MSDLNKVLLVGRLTRDPEVTEFAGGGKVAAFGFVVNNRRLNKQSGQWEEAPVWLNLKAFNREHGRKLADFAATLKKGRQVLVEGRLALEEWTGKEDGKKHSRLMVYADAINYLGGLKPKGEGDAQPSADHAPGEHVADGPEPDHAPGEHLADGPEPDHAAGEHVDDAGWPGKVKEAGGKKRGRPAKSAVREEAPF